MASFEIGDEVRDREDRDPDAAIVVNTPGVKCRNWDAYRDGDDRQVTVADDNPGYDAGAHVVVVAFKDDLEESRFPVEPDEPVSLGDMADAGVMSYAFPPGRLKKVKDPEEEIRDIYEHLEETGFDAELRNGYVEVEGLGRDDTYKVTAEGTVEGDGPIREHIEEALTNV